MKRTPGWFAALPSLVVPVCLGLSLYLGLQYLIDQKTIADETVLRYLTGHPVSKITVAMFFIGMSSVLLVSWNIFQQFASERRITLDQKKRGQRDRSGAEPESDISEVAVDHANSLLSLPGRLHSHYLWERLVNAVHAIYRTGSTSTVEEELKYLSDIDQERQQQRYSLVRILIWATPMLGFLGTVLGISQALGGISIGPDNDFQQMMDGLQSNLYIAFDTTALALTLSMGMMFAAFFAERFESQLLRLVDQRARSEIARHYELSVAGGGSGDSKQVVDAIQEVVENQTGIWRDSIRKAEQAWTASLTQTNDLVKTNLSESLDENVAALAHYLGQAIEKADASMSQRWSQWQTGLSENARLMEQHMRLLSEQTESVRKVVGKLEDATAFDSALQHQQNAVDATLQTHQVLSQLMTQVREFNLGQRLVTQAAAEAELAKSSTQANVETPPPEPEHQDIKSGEPELRIFDEESESPAESGPPAEAEIPAEVKTVPEAKSGVEVDVKENGLSANPTPEVNVADPNDLPHKADVAADQPASVDSSKPVVTEPTSVQAASSPLTSKSLVKQNRKPDSNSAKVLKAVGKLPENNAQEVLFVNQSSGEETAEHRKSESENENKTRSQTQSDVVFRKRPGNRKAA